MNYLARLQEILVGLKPPKIGLVTPLLGKKKKKKKKKHRVIFRTFPVFSLYEHIHSFV